MENKSNSKENYIHSFLNEDSSSDNLNSDNEQLQDLEQENKVKNKAKRSSARKRQVKNVATPSKSRRQTQVEEDSSDSYDESIKATFMSNQKKKVLARLTKFSHVLTKLSDSNYHIDRDSSSFKPDVYSTQGPSGSSVDCNSVIDTKNYQNQRHKNFDLESILSLDSDCEENPTEERKNKIMSKVFGKYIKLNDYLFLCDTDSSCNGSNKNDKINSTKSNNPIDYKSKEINRKACRVANRTWKKIPVEKFKSQQVKETINETTTSQAQHKFNPKDKSHVLKIQNAHKSPSKKYIKEQHRKNVAKNFDKTNNFYEVKSRNKDKSFENNKNDDNPVLCKVTSLEKEKRPEKNCTGPKGENLHASFSEDDQSVNVTELFSNKFVSKEINYNEEKSLKKELKYATYKKHIRENNLQFINNHHSSLKEVDGEYFFRSNSSGNTEPRCILDPEKCKKEILSLVFCDYLKRSNINLNDLKDKDEENSSLQESPGLTKKVNECYPVFFEKNDTETGKTSSILHKNLPGGRKFMKKRLVYRFCSDISDSGFNRDKNVEEHNVDTGLHDDENDLSVIDAKGKKTSGKNCNLQGETVTGTPSRKRKGPIDDFEVKPAKISLSLPSCNSSLQVPKIKLKRVCNPDLQTSTYERILSPKNESKQDVEPSPRPSHKVSANNDKSPSKLSAKKNLFSPESTKPLKEIQIELVKNKSSSKADKVPKIYEDSNDSSEDSEIEINVNGVMESPRKFRNATLDSSSEIFNITRSASKQKQTLELVTKSPLRNSTPQKDYTSSPSKGFGEKLGSSNTSSPSKTRKSNVSSPWKRTSISESSLVLNSDAKNLKKLTPNKEVNIAEEDESDEEVEIVKTSENHSTPKKNQRTYGVSKSTQKKDDIRKSILLRGRTPRKGTSTFEQKENKKENNCETGHSTPDKKVEQITLENNKRTPFSSSKNNEKYDNTDKLSSPLQRKQLTVTTPISKKKAGRKLLTPSMAKKDQDTLECEEDALDATRKQLHISTIPKSLPCRDAEFSQIKSFLLRKIEHSSGGCMYISGVPGTGKTATVHAVIRSLYAQADEGELKDFDFVEVNGLRLTEPKQAYVRIYQALTDQKVTPDQAQQLLNKRFSGNCKKSTVILVDELDYLCNRRQDVVYNILDWPSKRGSALVVLTISNTMDLPERTLKGRVTSRMGLTRLMFQPYSFHQLREIVQDRLCGFSTFHPDAVQLVARKVAAVSGDARRALDICRRTTEQVESGQQVTVGMVEQALTQIFSGPRVIVIQRLGGLAQLVLRSLRDVNQRTGLDETTTGQVYKHLLQIARLEGYQVPTVGAVLQTSVSLVNLGLVVAEKGRMDITRKLSLNVSSDDIHYALNNMKT